MLNRSSMTPAFALRLSTLVFSLVFALGTLAFPVVAPAQPLADDAAPSARLAYWFDQAARAFNEDRLDDWVKATEQLRELRPYHQDFMRHLVLGYARQNRLSEAFNTMLTMQQQGLTEDWSGFEELEPLRQHRLYGHIVELMDEAAQPFGRYEVLTTLPQDLAMPEALALESARERLFVGSLRDGRILARVGDGDWELFAAPEQVEGLMAVFDLSVDEARGHLWVATGNIPHFLGFDAQAPVSTALLKLDLETGERLASYGLPESRLPHALGAVVVAGDGSVYAADTRNPLVFRLAPGADQLELYFGSSNLASLRGMALSGDDRLLYIADYEHGLFVIATDGSQRAWQLAVPETLNVGGIDGLYWWDSHLVVIQNGVRPQRVLRLALGADGLGVTEVAPVLAAIEAFDTPTFGVMNGSRLALFSGSHWQHVDGRGRPLEATLPSIKLLQTDVDAPEIMVVGQEALRQLQGNR